MSKQRIPIHVYLNREYLGKFNSIVEAGQRASVTPSTVRQILMGNQECTKQGFYFSYDKLSDEEVEQLPIRDTMPSKEGFVRHDGRSCRKLVEESVFEVDCAKPQVFYQPRSKKERIDELKNFIFTKLHDRWMIVPKNIATLERQYIRETLSSLE
jgi:hypothetical protein